MRMVAVVRREVVSLISGTYFLLHLSENAADRLERYLIPRVPSGTEVRVPTYNSYLYLKF
jgi:hypothetical protein